MRVVVFSTAQAREDATHTATTLERRSTVGLAGGRQDGPFP